MKAIANRYWNRTKDILFLSPLSPVWRKKLLGKVMVLVYHRVDEPGRFPFLDKSGAPVTSPKELQSDLTFLKQQGATFFTAQDLRNGKFPSEREWGVIVTFDDGFRCSYTNGGQVLDELSIKAVFFQCTAMIGGEKLLPEHALYWFIEQHGEDKLRESFAEHSASSSAGTAIPAGRDVIEFALQNMPYVQLDGFLNQMNAYEIPGALIDSLYPGATMISNATSAGHEIGSHGHSHLYRDTMSDDQFNEELKISSETIGRLTGEPPGAISFPFGRFLEPDPAVVEILYSQQFSCEREPINPDMVSGVLGRYSWPGPAKNRLRQRRWLLTGGI